MPFAIPSFRRLTLTLAALAFAGATTSARPAQADTDDLLRFLAGAIVIGAIVNAVDDNHRPQPVGRWELPDSCLETVRVHRRSVDVYNSRCLSRANASNLPQECRYDYQHNGRSRSGYVAECLYDAGYRRQDHHVAPQPSRPAAVFLPAHCEMTYRQSGQRVNGYWAGCLRDEGLRNLPDQCRVTSTSGDRIFNADCLRDAGYRRSRH